MRTILKKSILPIAAIALLMCGNLAQAQEHARAVPPGGGGLLVPQLGLGGEVKALPAGDRRAFPPGGCFASSRRAG